MKYSLTRIPVLLALVTFLVGGLLLSRAITPSSLEGESTATSTPPLTVEPASTVATSTATSTTEVLPVPPTVPEATTTEASVPPPSTEEGTPSLDAATPAEMIPASAADCHREPFLSKYANPGECMRAARGF